MKWRNVLPLMLLTATTTAQSAPKYFAELQSGSLIGLVHISFGISIAKSHHFSIGLGYIPKHDSHQEMVLNSAKYRYEGDTRLEFLLADTPIQLSPANFGIAALTGHQDEIYRKNPEFLPDGYYYPTARRIIFNYQPYVKLPSGLELYADWSVLDVGLVNYARNFKFYRNNYKLLGLEGILNYGVGMRVSF